MSGPATISRPSGGSSRLHESVPIYRVPSWPPPKDFPVVVTSDMKVISRFGDSKWDLSVWHTTPKILNFGDGPLRRGTARISSRNADTFRCIVAWWLWGPRAITNVGTLLRQFVVIKKLFVVCTQEGIDSRNISRYPALIDKLAKEVPPANGAMLLGLLHAVYEQREQLNFMLLDLTALRRLAAGLPPAPEARQTAYIPARIWTYQVSRLRAVLDDFNSNHEKIGACYWALIDAYTAAFGSYSAARDKSVWVRPSSLHGSFASMAKDFEIDQLLLKWYSEKMTNRDLSIYSLASYLSLVNRAGLAYLLNFSLMRISEAWSLRTDCLQIEQDEKLGQIYMLCGETTKTLVDDDARWITSPTVKRAIDALTTIGSWRIKLKEEYCEEKMQKPRDDAPPLLLQLSCEPWSPKTRGENAARQKSYICYSELLRAHPKLFDLGQLQITADDWRVAKLVTPGLDSETFGVGKVWPFAWHQLRRTGAVNMQASGLVSDFSLQYQLKHSTLVSSLYYGQGYASVSLNLSAKSEYLRAMYEVMATELAQLLSDSFVSPYGDKRKGTILQIVSESDHEKLVAAAKSGNVAWRPTLLGGCTRRGPCEYGGIDNIVRCGGGDNKAPCADALFDRARVSAIRRLSQMLSQKIQEAEIDSPYRQSLEAQRRAAENALNVLNKQ